MLLDIGTEEIAHVEMLSVMISRLLEGAPVNEQEDAAKHPAVGAAMGGTSVRDAMLSGMNPQHDIVTGQGPAYMDSMGNPWSGAFAISSGNLLADFRYNLMAESQGNLQAGRLYNMTDDTGVRNMLSFNIARDFMHQNQWQAAIETLQEDGLHTFLVPGHFPLDRVLLSQTYSFWNLSEGEQSKEGRWASGPTPDGLGKFEYIANPRPISNDIGMAPQGDPRLYGTTKEPMPPTASGPNPREQDQNGAGGQALQTQTQQMRQHTLVGSATSSGGGLQPGLSGTPVNLATLSQGNPAESSQANRGGASPAQGARSAGASQGDGEIIEEIVVDAEPNQ
jgi:Mn-containing catalase